MYPHHYVIESIDASWRCLPTVAETAERIANLDAKARLADRYDNFFSIDTFISAHESAKTAAIRAGWKDSASAALVFWLPVENDVSYGFAFIADDGRAYVYSPVALPHINLVDPIDG